MNSDHLDFPAVIILFYAFILKMYIVQHPALGYLILINFLLKLLIDIMLLSIFKRPKHSYFFYINLDIALRLKRIAISYNLKT